VRRPLLALWALIFLTPTLRAAGPPPFEWKDGDRVVLVGDDLIERDQKYGYLETMITAGNPDKSITFRNLGWSGDTVFGHARAGFGTPADGLKKLKEGVLGLKPTVLIVGYGMAESFDGEAGLPAFVSGLNSLLDAFAPTKARVILLSPIAHEDLGHPLPKPDRHNEDLAKYRSAIKGVAEERHAWFVDLFEATKVAYESGLNLSTDDGIHLTETAYWYVGREIASALRGPQEGVIHAGEARDDTCVRIDVRDKSLEATKARITDLVISRDHVRFTAADRLLPDPKPARGPVQVGLRRMFSFPGLIDGRYSLTEDGKPVTTMKAEGWKGLFTVFDPRDPTIPQVAKLRATINAKNLLYFHRWRPQNETYLFGFRKYEQGNNAREIPLFDPLVEAKEKEIARLRKPVLPHVYELKREGAPAG
jgi:hypothetical protein